MTQGGPRAVEIDSAGNWWVLLAAGRSVARYEPMRLKWTTWPIDMYPHSIGIANDGRLWYNGHFTRARGCAGGPVPYELRIAPDCGCLSCKKTA